MSLLPSFHCEHCQEKHDLEKRSKMLTGFIAKAEETRDRSMVQKLKGWKSEIDEKIREIDIRHGNAGKTSDQIFYS